MCLYDDEGTELSDNDTEGHHEEEEDEELSDNEE